LHETTWSLRSPRQPLTVVRPRVHCKREACNPVGSLSRCANSVHFACKCRLPVHSPGSRCPQKLKMAALTSVNALRRAASSFMRLAGNGERRRWCVRDRRDSQLTSDPLLPPRCCCRCRARARGAVHRGRADSGLDSVVAGGEASA